jgi:hypothetical protein
MSSCGVGGLSIGERQLCFGGDQSAAHLYFVVGSALHKGSGDAFCGVCFETVASKSSIGLRHTSFVHSDELSWQRCQVSLSVTLSLGGLLGVEKTKSDAARVSQDPLVQAESRWERSRMWRAFHFQPGAAIDFMYTVSSAVASAAGKRLSTCRMACMGWRRLEAVVVGLRVCLQATIGIGWVWSLGGSTGLTRAQIPRFPASTAQPRAEQGPPPTPRDRSHFGQGVVQPGPVKPSTDCFPEKDGKGGCRGIQFCHSQLCSSAAFLETAGARGVLWASTDRPNSA